MCRKTCLLLAETMHGCREVDDSNEIRAKKKKNYISEAKLECLYYFFFLPINFYLCQVNENKQIIKYNDKIKIK